MPFDTFETAIDSPIAPARNAFAITPSDTAALPALPKAIYVGNGGNIALRSVDGTQDVVLYNVANGSILDVRAKYIRVTGTTAFNLIGLA